jgi:hypothetical protein
MGQEDGEEVALYRVRTGQRAEGGRLKPETLQVTVLCAHGD